MSQPLPHLVRIRALGPLRVSTRQLETAPVTQPRRLALLTYLVLAQPRGLHPRDTLMALLWPESGTEQGRQALRNSLHELRKALGDEVFVTAGNDLVGVDFARIECDVDQLAVDLADGRVSDALERYGELLSGFHVSEAPEFERWLDATRATCRRRVVDAALSAAVESQAAGNFVAGLRLVLRAQALDPDDERVLRCCLECSAASGDLAGATRTYRSFAARLASEYGASPAPETTTLMTRLTTQFKAREDAAPRPPVASPAPVLYAPGAAPVRVAAIRARRSVRWFVGAAVIIAALAAWPRIRPPGSLTAAASATSVSPFAVLPFDNATKNEDLAYFALGIAQSVAARLADGAGGSVLTFGSTQGLAQQPDSVRLRRLVGAGARAVVEGRLAGAREALIVSVSLRDVVTGRERFRLSVNTNEAQYAGAVAALTDSLRARLGATTATSRRAYVPQPEAYRLVSEADYAFAKRSRDGLRKSLALYLRAAELDARWVTGWIGVADAYGALANRDFMDRRTGFEASLHYADQAVGLEPANAHALITRALARYELGDSPGSAADARSAAALDSTDFLTQDLLAAWWRWGGVSLDSAWKYRRRAQRIRPWDAQAIVGGYHLLQCANDSVNALREIERALSLDPTRPIPLRDHAIALARFGRWDEAIEEWRKSDTVRAAAILGHVGALRGAARWDAVAREDARATLASLGDVARTGESRWAARVEALEGDGRRAAAINMLASWIRSDFPSHSLTIFCRAAMRDFVRDPRVQRLVRSSHWPVAEFDTLRAWHLSLDAK